MKKTIIGIAKKILPQKLKSKIKVFVAYHPYVLNPDQLFKKKELEKDLNQILNEKKRKGIVICPPTIDWHTSLYQRPHQIARAFAREGYLTFFCTNNLRFDSVKGYEKVEDNLYLTNNTALLKNISKDAIIIISWAINKFYADRFSEGKIVYEYMDELEVFDGDRQELEREHRWLVENAELVVATADKLYEQVKDKAKKAALVPNGVDLNHFLPHKTVMPKDIASIVKKYKKIIGYYGAIAEWFDFDLLNYAAEKRPDYGFIIIGPVDYDRSYAKYSDKMSKNIYFIGPKKYDELPSYALEFDVATIPFVVNKITESTSPIKLFEYMALEKPIVTTDLIECRKYKSVLIAEDKENFVEKLDEAISKETDNKYLEIERKEAENNSWESRVSLIIENLNKNEKDTSNS